VAGVDFDADCAMLNKIFATARKGQWRKRGNDSGTKADCAAPSTLYRIFRKRFPISGKSVETQIDLVTSNSTETAAALLSRLRDAGPMHRQSWGRLTYPEQNKSLGPSPRSQKAHSAAR